jgi:hypothetical protein
VKHRVVFRACFVVLYALACRPAPAAEAASPSPAVGRAPAAALGSLLFVPLDVYNAPAGELPALNPEAAANAFARAREAIGAGDVSGAFQHACAAVTLDPNHADARRLLGYQRIGDAWAGGYAQKMLDSDFAWRAEYGWIKAADVAKYDEGKRPYGGTWISATEDARKHAKVSRGWAVRTDHFLIMTNLDRAAGVTLAMRLETDYQLWRQLFGEFAATTEELQGRLDGKETSGYRRKPFRVIYHRDRGDYIDELKARQPGIEMSLGVYFDATRESHFFAGEGQKLETIDHEAVHQFFYESTARPTRNLAATANVWAVEGVACYFESLVQRGGSAFAVGGADAVRLQAARHRRTVDNYYVPLAELTALGVADLQTRSDIARLYSQSAGLASFFIDGQQGKYRDAFRRLLAEIYAGRDEPGTLARLTGRSYEELDGEYLEFLESLPVTAKIAP